ncbi:hypothetical protein J2847_006742 [Azospirillum agricola]|uniref:YgjV family protein n=1 Tax=Azospirillum agricola TaxID=1720247 RepID=UPI001AE4A55C|nr:YgjV family protein [Azospirillum agricola]MBP2233404.1 hypothetical protein [Azospirillum agricola]
MIDQIVLADAFGVVGFIIVALWPLARTRRALLFGQGVSAAAFTVHYLLIGAATGAVVTSLSLVQVATAWPAGARPWWCHALYASTSPMLVALTWATWVGWPSLLAGLGLGLATAARWQRRGASMRILLLLAAGAWLAHDTLIASAPGVLADLLCAGTLLYGWLRDAPRPTASECL